MLTPPYPRIIQYPPWADGSASALGNAFFGTSMTQDLSNEALAFWGPLTMPQGWVAGDKTITAVEVYYNTVTPGSGSTWRVSLQSMSASGNPPQPDGVVDQVWTGAPSGITAGVLTTHTFDTGRVVSPGERVALVFDYSVFGSATVMAVRNLASVLPNSIFGVSTFNGSVWADGVGVPCVAFVCSDGSRLYYEGCYYLPHASNVSSDFQSTSTGTTIDSGDERGMLWVPKKCYDVYAFGVTVRLTNATSTNDIIMYRDTTSLLSRTINATDIRTTGGHMLAYAQSQAPIRVFPGENIRFVQRPGTSTSRWYRWELQDAAAFQRFFGSPNNEVDLTITNRVDGGGWNTPSGNGTSFAPFQVYGVQVPLPGEHIIFR